MNGKDAIEFIRRMSYGPNARIKAARSHHDYNILEISVIKQVPHAVSGEVGPQVAMSVIDIKDIEHHREPEKLLIKMVCQTIMNLEHHEIDEWFKIDGVCVNNPHPELAIQFRADI